MYQSRFYLLLSVFALPALGLLVAAGCSSSVTTPAEKKQQKRIDRDTTNNNTSNVSVNEETSDNKQVKKSDGAMYFPVHGNERVLKLERTAPAETRVGVEFPYSITVTNVSSAPAHDVIVKEHVNGELQLVQKDEDYWFGSYENYDPYWTENDHIWDVGTLQPEETRTLNLVGLAQEEGTLKSCLSADFESRLCSSTQVTDPRITLRRDFVDQDGNTVNAVYKCDEVYSRYRVKNVGSGSTGDVMIQEDFKNGIAVNNSAKHSYTSDSIATGDTSEKNVRVQLNGQHKYTGRASASMGDVSVRSNRADLTVMQPELQLRVFGPERDFLERDVTHRVSVKNTSDDPAIKTFVQLNLPESSKMVSTSLARSMENGRVELGRLEAGETRTFDVTFRPTKVSTIETGVSAGAYCVETQNKRIRTSIEGHPAIGMEVTDTLDPVKIGETTRYMINIKNQGTAADEKVRLRGILPEGTEFVRATGETNVKAEGKKLIFDVPNTLEVGQSFSWEVHVRATKAGSGYFTLKLDSNANSRTVTEEEPTNMVE